MGISSSVREEEWVMIMRGTTPPRGSRTSEVSEIFRQLINVSDDAVQFTGQIADTED